MLPPFLSLQIKTHTPFFALFQHPIASYEASDSANAPPDTANAHPIVSYEAPVVFYEATDSVNAPADAANGPPFVFYEEAMVFFHGVIGHSAASRSFFPPVYTFETSRALSNALCTGAIEAGIPLITSFSATSVLLMWSNSFAKSAVACGPRFPAVPLSPIALV